ncbi:MAG: polymer-forming cytoskeletal protein [Treponemataceae bacterium]|nr:polymer-forming cytoskeletal protein [Treponemataceae bacterium]
MEKSSKNITILGSDTEFDGVLEFTDNLKISGKFNGTIKSSGNLEIDKAAVCTVDKISAGSVVVSGTVRGDILADERIEMCNGSKVMGNIETARLRIADNVEFDGQVSMLGKEPDIDLFSVASAEYKRNLVLKSDSDVLI